MDVVNSKDEHNLSFNARLSSRDRLKCVVMLSQLMAIEMELYNIHRQTSFSSYPESLHEKCRLDEWEARAHLMEAHRAVKASLKVLRNLFVQLRNENLRLWNPLSKIPINLNQKGKTND